MCSETVANKYRTMFFVTILVLVSVVGANVNSTSSEVNAAAGGRSRMAWMKTLLDHHEWSHLLRNNTMDLSPQCAADLREYITALDQGQLWASKSKLITLLIYTFKKKLADTCT